MIPARVVANSNDMFGIQIKDETWTWVQCSNFVGSRISTGVQLSCISLLPQMPPNAAPGVPFPLEAAFQGGFQVP